MTFVSVMMRLLFWGQFAVIKVHGKSSGPVLNKEIHTVGLLPLAM